MSIIQQIREKYAAIGFGIIALSLVAFILMDAGRNGDGGGITEQDVVAAVNGTKISYGEFTKRAKQMEDQYGRQGRVIDEDTRQQINSMVWTNMINEELVLQEVKKLGITISDKEFNDILFGKNPPDDIKQAFTDPKTGIFDAAAARQNLAQQKKTIKGEQRNQVEEYFKALVKNYELQKYNTIIRNSIYAPTWLAEKTLADNNLIVGLNYVAIPFTSISDSVVKVSTDAISAYISSHKTEFKQEEDTRSIEFVNFSFAPSASDSADALNGITSLKQDFITSSDPSAFVSRNASSINFYDGYNSKAKIQIAQKDSIIGRGVGTVYGPYLDGDNYVISRVVAIKTLPDSVRVRHILIGVSDEKGQEKRDDATAKALADSLLGLVNRGADFGTLAFQYSEDPGSKEKGGVYEFFPSGQMVKEFNDFVFEKGKGERAVVKTQFGYHVIEILDQKNFEAAYKIAYMGKQIVASQETINNAQNAANIFYGECKNLTAFGNAVNKGKANKMAASDIKETDFQVQGLGISRKIVKEIFKKKVGDILEPTELNNNYVVIAISGAEKAGLISAEKARPQVESLVRNIEKAKLIVKKVGKITSLESLAQTQSVVVKNADSVAFASPLIPELGYEPKVGGFAFDKSALNKISEPITGNSGVFVIKPTYVSAKPEFGATVEGVKIAIESQQKNTASYTSTISALNKIASIQDKREKFPF